MSNNMTRTTGFFAALTLALVLAGVLVASSMPDGLEHVAEALGFAGLAQSGPAYSPFADYQASFFQDSWLAQVTAGLVGVGLMYGFGILFGKTLRKKGDG